MPSNIHKKLVYGALGCGGLLVVGMALALWFGREGMIGGASEPQVFTQYQSAEAWDSLAATPSTVLFSVPPLPELAEPRRAPGFLLVTASRTHDPYPLFYDTFPPGSAQRQKVVLTAQRVAVMELSTVPARPPMYPAPYVVLFRSRILLAAADDWSLHGDLSEAVIALDSALTLARVSLHSSDLERVMIGGRVERDARDLLSRDTLLAGGPLGAKKAAAVVTPLSRFVKRLESVDHWMVTAGASPRYCDSLARWAADGSLPVPWRRASVQAIGVGWAFSSFEPSTGVDRSRGAILRRLRTMQLPDSVRAEIDRVDSLGSGGFAERMGAVAPFRAERLLLFLP